VTVVVKLGTSLVVGGDGLLREELLAARGREVVAAVRGGEPVCVVSSGAIALGLPHLGLDRRPRSVPRLQAASALGQARLHAAWERALEPLPAAQVLLTAGDVADRAAYVNARNALQALFRLGAVPVVNENDATATDEITFGDNDALAAHVAVLVRARLLVLLTEVEGVYTRAPGTPGAELVADGAEAVEFGPGGRLGRGGMRSKVVAARMAAQAGIPTVIAGGAGDEVLPGLLAGETRGTRFAPADARLSSFKLWLRFGKPARGRLHVDDGARRALVEAGASLLAVGVTAAEGRFEPGDAVELVGPGGDLFGKGIAEVSAADVERRSRGLEVVHRDRLVVYAPGEAAAGGRPDRPRRRE
jgi:glutamate 5-kinase